ncbi:MAG TPA: HEAT repeat domain-containing protein [bacterium]|nr:HEAT repeat domain-containing protein [bacterium]HPN30487.1 HEAT repeat domain-containing protein [bacterium]
MKTKILKIIKAVLALMEIRKEEANKVFLLLCLCIPMGITMVLAFSITNSIFNVVVGPASLPYMFLGIGLLQLPFLLGLNNFVNRKNIYLSTKRALFFSIIIIAVNWFLFLKTGINGGQTQVFYKILTSYIFISTFLSVYIVNFLIWIIASEMFTIRESKRLLVHLSGGYYIGVISGGLALTAAVRYFKVMHIYVTAVLFLGAALYLLNLIQKKYAKSLDSGNEDDAREKITISENYKYLKDSRYSKLVITMFIMFNLLRCFFLFQFNIAAEYNFPDTEKLTQYFGFYESLNAAASIILTFFLINKIILFLGVWNTMIFTAFGFAATFFIVLTKDVNIYVLSIGALINESIYYLVMPPLHTLVFKPVDMKIRTAIMSISNLVSESLGNILSFVFGLFIAWEVLDFFGFSAFSILISLVICGILIYSKKEYIKILSEAIKSKNSDILEHSSELFGKLQSSMNESFITEILQSNDPDVIKISLQFLQNMKSSTIVKYISPLLDSNDAETRALAVLTLGNLEKVNGDIIGKISGLLNDSNYKVKINSIKALNKLGCYQFNEKSESLLEYMLDSDSIERKIQAVETIGILKFKKFNKIILSFINNDNFFIRIAAIKTTAELYGSLPENSEEEALALLVEQLTEIDDSIRNAAVDSLEIVAKNNVEIFGKMLASKNLFEWEASVELIARWDFAANYDFAVSSALIHIKEIFENMISIRELKKIPFTDAVEPLVNKLENNNQIIMRVVFRIFVIKNDAALINSIKTQLYNPDKNIRMNAIEALENIGESKIVKALIPLFEFAEKTEIIEAAKKLWKLEDVKYQKTLVSLLYDNDSWVRACSAYIMGELSSADFEQPLTSYLNDYNKKLIELSSNESKKIQMQKLTTENSLVCENVKIALNNIEMLKKLLFEEDFIMPEKSEAIPLMEKIIFLKKMPLFSQLEAEQLTAVANLIEEKNYPENTEICKENTLSEDFFIVVNGELIKEIKSKNSVIEVIKNYSYFGELSILDDKFMPYSVTASTAVKLFKIQKRDFLYLIEKNSSIGFALLRQMCSAVRICNSAV